ncbi:putative RNA 2'-phosphotransferase [Methylopila capsulata]|uniref:RNA 2'-phosphotransferase n=1 Tax=Methylopila capsulata TaxID=61654 RepID=A0A9W6IVB1_9HYPH|nr:putative RNA 2'-phosphotransferase [Methylopila capsulata]
MSALIDGAAKAGVALDRAALAVIMAESDKARFELSDDGERIRAVHGHSVDVETHGPAETPPDILWHGTAQRFLPAILTEGLTSGARRFVHLSETAEMAREVGARHGRPAVLTVSASDMAAQGFAFYRSSSGVWLTPAVPSRFLTQA